MAAAGPPPSQIDAARRVERAVTDAIAAGRSVTYDLKPRRDDPTAVGAQEMADAIIAAMGPAIP